MRRLYLMATLAVACWSAACGSGGSIPAPPPPVGNYSNASLLGQYAYSMSGLDGQTGASIFRVGSFIADGKGNITAALEDVQDLGNPSPPAIVNFGTGSYSILANGRGTLALGSGTNTLLLSIVLNSASQGLMIQTDLNATSSGGFNLQTPANFSLTGINGKYVFDVSGVSFTTTNVAPLSVIGEVQADGNGNVLGGTLDENDANATAPSGAITFVAGGAYQLDPTNSNGAIFGRGTINVNGRTFVFYIVDGTRMKWMEEDNFAATLGDAVAQSNTIATQNSAFTGSFVSLVGGSTSQGPIARAARFTADGNGGIGSINLDENNNGSISSIQQGSNISSASYSIDVAHAGTGRGTCTFTDSHSGTFSYVFYQISAAQAVLQDISQGLVADGALLAQTGGPFSNSSVAGNCAFNWSGISLLSNNNNTPFEEDFVGQYTLSSSTSNNVSGAVDFVELGSSGRSLFPNVRLTGGLTINGDGTNSNDYRFVVGNSPFKYKAYFANPRTVFLLDVDSARVTAGITSQQQ